MTSNQSATVTASYTSGGVTKTATQGVTIVNAANVLTSIAVSGPSSVNESSTATYTATGDVGQRHDDGDHPDVERVSDDVRLDQHGRRADDVWR